MQVAVCDEYIAVIDAKPYASDMECFIPLMENSKKPMAIILNILLQMPDMVPTIITFIARNMVWRNS